MQFLYTRTAGFSSVSCHIEITTAPAETIPDGTHSHWKGNKHYVVYTMYSKYSISYTSLQ